MRVKYVNIKFRTVGGGSYVRVNYQWSCYGSSLSVHVNQSTIGENGAETTNVRGRLAISGQVTRQN